MNLLETRPLGSTGLSVTRVGFGALEIGRDWGVGTSTSKPEAEEAGRMLHAVLEMGINLIDTARAYHRSEERIGLYLADRRGEYVLATKAGEASDEPRTYYDFSYEGITKSIDLSLELLKTEVIDVLQIHFGPDPDKVLDEGETVRAMKDAREAGKVRFLGASPGNGQLDRCIESGDFQVLQVGYSLTDQGAKDLITKAADRGIGVLIRSGLGGGWLTSRALQVPEEKRPEKVNRLLELVGGDAGRLQHLALAFLKSHPEITSVLIGSKNPDNLQRSVELFDTPIDEDLLQQAVRAVS